MKAVVQRVSYASVKYEDVENKIGKGLVVFIGVGINDTQRDVDYLVNKIVKLRIFEDEIGKMNKSVLDINGEILVISEFTLYGDCKGSNRPDFTKAAKFEVAKELYDSFLKKLLLIIPKEKVKTGKFGAYMFVNILNDGPVTIILES